MSSILKLVQRHPLVIAAAITLWAIAWMVTVLTWQRDAAGYSVGMAPAAIVLHLLLPIALGGLAAHLNQSSVAQQLKAGALFGLAFGAFEFLVLLPVDLLWLPSLASEPPLTEQLFGTLAGMLVYMLLSLLLSTIGAALTGQMLRINGRRTPGSPSTPVVGH
jgi:hypothetical protein